MTSDKPTDNAIMATINPDLLTDPPEDAEEVDDPTDSLLQPIDLFICTGPLMG